MMYGNILTESEYLIAVFTMRDSAGIGCIGCPMAGTQGMLKEFARYPKYYEAYLRAFERMLQVRRDNGKPYTHWQSAQDVMDWWIYGQSKISVNEDQLSLFDRGDYDSEPD